MNAATLDVAAPVPHVIPALVGIDRRFAAEDEPAALSIHLLGTFRVLTSGYDVPAAKWRLRKARQLVALLALAPAHRLHREQVMDTLWPDLEPEAAANNLHYTLHVARRSLDPDNTASGRLLRLHGGQVMLQPDGRLWTDVCAFEAAAMAARASGEPAAFQRALDLYSGDLLPEDPYEDWAVERRQFLRDTYLTLLFGLAGALETRGELEAAAETLRQVVESDAAHEPAHAALMRLYAGAGRRAQALRQYQQLRAALARELDVGPDPATEALHADILAGRLPATALTTEVTHLSRPSQAAQQDARRAHNLPAPLTSFTGRAHDLAKVERALSAARLITLTGPGGSGKTRLAIEVSRASLAAFADGVWLVELAEISDPAPIPQALALALGLDEQPGRPLAETVVDALRDRQALVVLDNCEHLLHGCARWTARLLAACPRLRVLATSREPLHVPGELIWPLPPLAAPEPGRVLPLRCLEQVEAVRLFIERARLSRPSFTLTLENAGAVAGICGRLAGLPLAIELAASWTRMFSAEQIDTLLATDLRLILDDQGSVHAHQRGLRATVERSYDLLTPAEQALFRRLAVFAGGCTLAAALAVCCSDDEPALPCRAINGEHAVLATLAALVDKNLLRQEEPGDGEPRFAMLETIRAYGLLRLEERGETATVRERHAGWYLALVEKWRAALSEGDSPRWLNRLQRERDNFRAALGWAASQAHSELGLRLATALYGFWYIRGPMSEGFAWLTRFLEHPAAPAALRIQACYMAGELARVQGDSRQAMLLAERCLTAARAADDTAGVARALFLLANIADSAGDHARAITLHEQSLALYRASGDKDRIAMGLANLGDALLMQGELARAVPMFEEALTLWRELDSAWGASIALLNLAEAARQAGDLTAATRLARESLRLSRELDDHWGVADCFTTLAEIAVGSGQPERAARLLGAAEALRGEIGVATFADSHAQAARVTLAARAALGAGPFVELRAEGRTISIERAISFAIGD